MLHCNLQAMIYTDYKILCVYMNTQICMEGANAETMVCMRLLPGVMYCGDVDAALLTFSMKWKVSDASGLFGGAFLFSEDGQSCIIDYKNTPALLFHLSSTADREPLFFLLLLLFFVKQI